MKKNNQYFLPVKKQLTSSVYSIVFWLILALCTLSNSLGQTIKVQQSSTTTGWKRDISQNELIAFPIPTSTLSFSITNTGGANLAITLPLVPSGAGASSFSITQPATATLAPNTSTTFQITYSPASASITTAQLTISSNSTTNDAFLMNLKGAGNALSGPVYPPPGGVTFVGSGAIGAAGGRTLSYSAVAAATDTYWGPQITTAGDLQMMASMNGGTPTYSGQEIFTYSPTESNLANGIAVWRAATTISSEGAPPTTVYLRNTLTTKRGDNVTIFPLIDPTSIGLSEQVGGLIKFTGPSDVLKANYFIEASTTPNGSFSPFLTFFDNWPMKPASSSGNAATSLSNGFYYVSCIAPSVYTVTGSGTVCSGSGISIGLSNSQPGVTYNLLNASNTIVQSYTSIGTGSFTFANPVTTAGTYTVDAVTTGNSSCTSTMTGSATVTVVQPPTASISYGAASFCATGSVSVTLTGTNSYTGGTYSSTGLIINSTTGTINLATSTLGTYTVFYFTPASVCPSVVAQTSVTIKAVPVATLTASGPISASSTSVTLTAGGGTTYIFSPGATQIGGGNTATVTTAGIYSVTATTNGCSSTATTSVITTDLTPIIYARPSTQYGTSACTVVVDVIELSGVASQGTITVKVTRDAKISLTLPASATQVGGRPVQNNAWTFNSSDPGYYILTTSQSVPSGDKLSFGLTGLLTAGSTTGVIPISAVIIMSGSEAVTTNNTDADKIDYFQQ